MRGEDLIELSRELVNREAGRPRQTSLKRAVSTAYYALFHDLAHVCIEKTITWGFRSSLYWQTVTPLYRAVDHSGAKRVLEKISRETSASAELKQVARAFIELQEARIHADYNPAPMFSRRSALDLVARSEDAMRKLKALPDDTKRLLAAQLLGKQR